MKKIVLIALLFLGMTGLTNAQYAWSQRDSLTGLNRQSACGFSIGNKGYIGLGLN
jgi:hypothetical protein